MTLDLSKLRQRLEARKPRVEVPRRGARRPPPEPVVKRQEEQRALYEAAERRRKAKLVRAANTHPEVARYLSVLSRELPETSVVEPGLVDLDLDHAITGLRLHLLSPDVRVLVLGETMQWLKNVHKLRTRDPDITPYARLFDPHFVDSLSEARNALCLH